MLEVPTVGSPFPLNLHRHSVLATACPKELRPTSCNGMRRAERGAARQWANKPRTELWDYKGSFLRNVEVPFFLSFAQECWANLETLQSEIATVFDQQLVTALNHIYYCARTPVPQVLQPGYLSSNPYQEVVQPSHQQFKVLWRFSRSVYAKYPGKKFMCWGTTAPILLL